MKGTSLDTCVHCLAGKQYRLPFNRISVSRKITVLYLVHSDVCGSMTVSTLGGTFIDDHSRKVWANALRTKHGVLEAFKLFKTNVERQTGKTLKCIHSYNGGEYRGPFEKFCKDNGIKHKRTVPKLPRQNGATEKMNRTIVDRIQCIMI